MKLCVCPYNTVTVNYNRSSKAVAEINRLERELSIVVRNGKFSSHKAAVVGNSNGNNDSVTLALISVNGTNGESCASCSKYGRAESYEHNCYHCDRKELLHFCPP